jgi:hypothetical protein
MVLCRGRYRNRYRFPVIVYWSLIYSFSFQRIIQSIPIPIPTPTKEMEMQKKAWDLFVKIKRDSTYGIRGYATFLLCLLRGRAFERIYTSTLLSAKPRILP